MYRKPGRTVSTPPLTLENETLINVSKITGTYFNLNDSTIKNSDFVVGKETCLAQFRNCDLTDCSIEYEAEGPAVDVGVEACRGTLKETGPGLERRRPRR